MARSLRSPAGRGGLFGLPRPVWLLGWVSLATDSASEAIYPLLPFFLTQVLGAGAVSLGIVEGAAEAANSILKIVSGRAADRTRLKRPLVLAGYTISSLVRPLIAIAQSWTHVFTIRLVDRIGKGIRGAPRDAMLAGWATPTTRGKIYGFHRAMDHTGAVVGPALASLFLFFYPGSYRALFALTIIPGAIAVLLIFFVHEPHVAAEVGSGSDVGSGFSRIARDSEVRSLGDAPVVGGAPVGSGFSRITDDVVSDARRNEISAVASHGSRTVLESFPRKLKGFFGVLSLFMLGNSTDAFLLLKLTEVAGSAKFIPLMWAGLHLVKASVSIVGGSWSDRIGRRAVIVMGWLVYAAVYVGFAITDSLVPLLACFFTYGLYFGFAEGTEKALVADLAPESRRGFAFGVYNAVLGLGALTASILFGLLWSAFGPHVAFGVGAALALLASALLFIVV
jgi:MFS family permease